MSVACDYSTFQGAVMDEYGAIVVKRKMWQLGGKIPVPLRSPRISHESSRH
jgi:hypothetical protein